MLQYACYNTIVNKYWYQQALVIDLTCMLDLCMTYSQANYCFHSPSW